MHTYGAGKRGDGADLYQGAQEMLGALGMWETKAAHIQIKGA